jgi:hypothetical protein
MPPFDIEDWLRHSSRGLINPAKVFSRNTTSSVIACVSRNNKVYFNIVAKPETLHESRVEEIGRPKILLSVRALSSCTV